MIVPLGKNTAIVYCGDQIHTHLVHPKPKFGCYHFEGPGVFELDIAVMVIIFRQREIVTELQAILQVEVQLQLKTKTI